MAGGFLAAAFLAGASLLDFLGGAFLAAAEVDALRGADALASGPWVRLVIRPLQSFNGHMGVDLGGRERSVAE